MGKSKNDARVIARLDQEEQAMLRRARILTGDNTSGVIKAALRQYAKTLPDEAPIDIFERCGVVGSVAGPTDLSETYKQHIDYSDKHGSDKHGSDKHGADKHGSDKHGSDKHGGS